MGTDTMTEFILDRDGRGFTVRVPVPASAPLLKVNDGHKPTHIKFQVNYDKGGDSMFGGKARKRGYRIRITPVEFSDHLESMTLLSGFNVSGGYFMLEEVKSFNAKRLQAWASAVAPRIDAITQAFIDADHDSVVRLCEAVRL